MTKALTRPGRLAVVDLFAFLTLALGIGLTTGVALGAVVLLLSNA